MLARIVSDGLKEINNKTCISKIYDLLDSLTVKQAEQCIKLRLIHDIVILTFSTRW